MANESPAAGAVPLTLLTGFLGSGKTTLLNRILRGDHGKRVGVLVNDFGAINVDARLVAGIQGDSIDLSNGCVCCSMRGDLVSGVKRLLDRPSPFDHVILEASGIADPFRVISALRAPALRERVRLAAVITMMDAEHAQDPRLDRQLVEDQIRAGDVVVVNKG